MVLLVFLFEPNFFYDNNSAKLLKWFSIYSKNYFTFYSSCNNNVNCTKHYSCT